MQTLSKHPEMPTIPPQRHALRVLIVEDEQRLRDLLLDVIPEMGFDAFAAKSAEQAIKIMESEPADIAILDLQLPVMGGMEFFQIIRDRWPTTGVIILTGFGDLAAARRAIRLDVVDFLSKPFHLNDIEVALDRAVKRVPQKNHASSVAIPSQEARTPLTLQENERQLILAALYRHHGNRTTAAAELGISRRKLHYWLNENAEENK